MLPYASDHRPTRPPLITWTLLGITTLLSLWVIFADRLSGPGRSAEMLASVGIVPAHFHPLTLFTYPFFHSSLAHLLINLFYLWVFGAGVEEAVGRSRYILLYLACGAVGGLLQWFVTITLLPPQSAQLPVVGASAACAGLMGLFAVRYYRARLAFVGLPFRPHVVSVVACFLFVEIGLGLYALFAGSASDGVAHWAHVGGFIFGLACAQLMNLSDAGERAYLNADATRAMDRSVPGAAIKKWEILLAREPGNAQAHAELARAWLLLGDTDHAGQHYFQALQLWLAKNQRPEAAALYAEIRSNGASVVPASDAQTVAPARTSVAAVLLQLTAAQLFSLGCALEEQEQYALAAEAFRAVTVRATHTPESETALLKAAALYLRNLGRAAEAKVLLNLFLDRCPHSPYRALAQDLQREAEAGADSPRQ